jgi:hypothetical protein
MTKRGDSPLSGAYYSARLAACEYLKTVRRCARVIIIRRVSGDYWAPLGTWVIREAARRAMNAPPVACPSLDVAVTEVSARLGSGSWLGHSTLIPELKTQRTLF